MTSEIPKTVSEKIAVSALGDPLAKSTWSGTPFRLCHELKKMGRLGPTYNVDAYAPWPIPRLARLAARLYYFNSHESSRGKLTRFLRQHGLKRFLDSNSPRHVLHLGSLALPMRQQDLNTKHYLFCDSTWHLWSKDSTNQSKCSKRLLRDAETLESLLYPQMSRIFSISGYVKDDLIAHYGLPPEKIVVVATGRGSIAPYYGPKDYASGRILFVAKERFADKGGDLLVEAFKMAVAKNPSLHLILVGDQEYERFTREHPNISAHGYVTAQQLQQLFDEAALFAMPALNEPWGLVYLEALSCQTPILGLSRNAIPEMTGAGSYGFLSREPAAESISQTLLQAFADVDRLAQMGRSGQDYCLSNFTWEQTANRIVEAIDSQAEV